jgi:hypothetical protein
MILFGGIIGTTRLGNFLLLFSMMKCMYFDIRDIGNERHYIM